MAAAPILAPSYSMRNDRDKRIIYLRMTGPFDLATMQQCMAEMRIITNSYRGEPHFMLADLRGFVPAFSDVAAAMGEGIKHCRANGIKCCAHLSDNSVTRLQAARLARAATVGDDITVDVVSEAEGERLLAERLQALGYKAAV
jgi:hypothetical protein